MISLIPTRASRPLFARLTDTRPTDVDVFRFLDLPPELRGYIYAHFFDGEPDLRMTIDHIGKRRTGLQRGVSNSGRLHDYRYCDRGRKAAIPALSYVNKAVSREALAARPMVTVVQIMPQHPNVDALLNAYLSQRRSREHALLQDVANNFLGNRNIRINLERLCFGAHRPLCTPHDLRNAIVQLQHEEMTRLGRRKSISFRISQRSKN